MSAAQKSQSPFFNRSSLVQMFPRPLISSRPLAWKDVIVEVYRARDVKFSATHSEHVIALQLRGSNDVPQHGHTPRKFIRSGNINITPAGVVREWRYDGEVEILVLRIAPSLLESISAESQDHVQPLELTAHSGIRDAQIEHLSARLLDELRAGGLASRACARLLANLLAIHLLRHYSSGRASAENAAGKLTRHKLRQATDFINKNLRDDLSLGKISEALCMSPYHFAHVFKQTTGLAPHRYVIECRMEKAKSLLRDTNLPVNEIAQMVGYSSQSHFSSVFRQFTGQSPLRYRDV